MRNLFAIGLILLSLVVFSQQEIAPYFKVAELDLAIDDASSQVAETIRAHGFDIIGSYHPGKNDHLNVICFTSDDLRKLSLQFTDRGPLASVLKAALVQNEGKTTLSILNPEYMFLAYWGGNMKGQEKAVTEMSDKVKGVFQSLGTLASFGGSIEKDELPGYHYKVMMPYFDDPDILREFDSFEAGLAIIRKNLEAQKGQTIKVYEQVFMEDKIAVFGIGLANAEDGEAYFLPVIGEDHIANMPYEIILQGKEASSLAGKYRIALYWPELTMGTFMQIMSTPGDIVETLEAITKE